MNDVTAKQNEMTLAGVPEGLDALVLAQLVRESGSETAPGIILHVARDDRRLDALETALGFFAPNQRIISMPAWDTVPYDRVGPHPDITAKRITAMAKLVMGGRKEPTIVLTTVNAILQKMPPRAFIRQSLRPMAATAG